MKYVLMAFASMFMVACSDENEVVPSSVEDGTYKVVINLNSLAGDAQASRAIDASGFIDMYDNGTVFIHAVGNGNGSEIGSIEIPVSDSSVEFTVNVNTEGNSVTISSSSSSDSSLKMGINDKIYFSSIATENWEATRASWQGFTPISKSAAFTNGESTMSELYRSPEGNGESYTIAQLMELDKGTLTMYRKCSAYSLAVMFSDLKNGVADGSDMTYTFTEEDWKLEFTGNVAYMYGKGYVGGFFPEVYNVYSGACSWKQNSDKVTTPEAGYYVTNNQMYTQLAELSRRQIVDSQIHEYIGCGFQSVDYIRTPVVESAEGEMSVYVLFKPSADPVTKEEIESADNNFNKEDVSVKMVKVTLDGMTPIMNVVSAITLVFDYRRLKDVFNNPESVYLTRTTEGGIPIIPMEPDVIIYQ